MSVIGLDHVQLGMPAGGEEQARAFYSELLGLTERAKPAPIAARGGCWFENGAVKLHLGVEADFRPARKAHPALIVSDLAGVAAHLAQAGFSTFRDVPIEGYERLAVHDPFGNRIELMARQAAP